MTDALPPSLVFGVPISHVDNDSVVDRIVELATLGRQRGTTHQVATVNVDFLVNGLGDAAVLSILRRADMCLADGMPVVWAARAFGAPLPERVAGADLVPRLIEASARTGLRIHIFGSSADVAERSTALLHERYPGARFSIDPGPMIPDPTHVDDDVLASIAATGADVLLVALGNPKQERFITTHRERLGIPVSIGVGGSLDMLTGERRRAPQAVQRLGLEWVYRAAQEPQRLGRRYAHDIRVFSPTSAA
ncbi:MAG: WecB/TagA/CpsF family glycosyltransferase [Ilumatobacteraceae bacterium]